VPVLQWLVSVTALQATFAPEVAPHTEIQFDIELNVSPQPNRTIFPVSEGLSHFWPWVKVIFSDRRAGQ
jgi:hypothetical protein